MIKQAVRIIALKLMLCLIPILSLSACERKSEFESCIEQICISPTVLNSGKVITLKVPNWHPKKLAVKSPSGEWYYVNDTDFQFFDDFETATEFSFVVRDLKAIKYNDGKPIVEMVFSIEGEYLFYFDDNLETEPENTRSTQIVVKYQAQ